MEGFLKLEAVDKSFLSSYEGNKLIPKALSELTLRKVTGNPSWEGLAVIFPGDRRDLATRNVGTPFIRMILYQILDLHHRLREKQGGDFPCVYFIGDRFSDVFLRKLFLLDQVIPHIIVLSNDLFNCYLKKTQIPRINKGQEAESWFQKDLCTGMNFPNFLSMPVQENKQIQLGLIASEVPCWEGAVNPERLDILGYDKVDHSLVAFELKGPNSGRVGLENLFLQGMEHRNWLEKNRMAIKLFFDKGPGGEKINSENPVRLVLGIATTEVPHLFFELREEAVRRKKWLKIDFVRMERKEQGVVLSTFDEEKIQVNRKTQN